MFVESGLLDNAEKREVLTHRPIVINIRKHFGLFFKRCCVSKLPKSDSITSKEDKRLMKLYEKVSVRIEDDMDIIKIIKSLRELKILASNSMMNVLTRF